MNRIKTQDTSAHQRVRHSHTRRATLFVLALWGRTIPVFASSVNDGVEIQLPSIQDSFIYLPQQWLEGRDNADRIRAAATHAAAHEVYGGGLFDSGDLNQRQKILIGIIEDARVEYLACQELPGLRQLWSSMFSPEWLEAPGFSGRVRRLAFALLNEEYRDNDMWVQKGVHLFRECVHRIKDHQVSYEIGLRLAHDMGQLRLSVDEGRVFQVNNYRDDNQHLWAEVRDVEMAQDIKQESSKGPVQESVSFREANQGRVLELAEQQGRQAMPGSFWLRDVQEDAVVEYRKHEDVENPTTYRYPEWHYQLQIPRQNWCTVYEHEVSPGNPELIVRLLCEYRPLLTRMQRVVRVIKLEKLRRVCRQKEGDDVDLDAAIVSLGQLHAGLEPDPRIHIKARHLHDRGLASLLLLDVSESINDSFGVNGASILEIARNACALLALTMDELKEPFALQGFCSNTRNDVHCYNIKTFEQAMSSAVMARISGIQARYSTRMGAALRHAIMKLQQQAQHRRVLLLLTDGAPSDVDVYDPAYLLKDARQAVLEARASGVLVYALCLDPAAGESMARIFGAGHYTLLDNIERLPEMLTGLFLRLVRDY